ncbi:MAG: hypothetical protein ACRD3B_04515 [Candidatus Sulfotelmatobacter sp.]
MLLYSRKFRHIVSFSTDRIYRNYIWFVNLLSGFGNPLSWIYLSVLENGPLPPEFKPRSGARIQPTAQAMGSSDGVNKKPEGAKEIFIKPEDISKSKLYGRGMEDRQVFRRSAFSAGEEGL